MLSTKLRGEQASPRSAVSGATPVCSTCPPPQWPRRVSGPAPPAAQPAAPAHRALRFRSQGLRGTRYLHLSGNVTRPSASDCSSTQRNASARLIFTISSSYYIKPTHLHFNYSSNPRGRTFKNPFRRPDGEHSLLCRTVQRDGALTYFYKVMKSPFSKITHLYSFIRLLELETILKTIPLGC